MTIWSHRGHALLPLLLAAAFPTKGTADEPKLLATLGGHSKVVSRLAVTPDGKLLATGSVDQTVKIWDISSHKEVASLPGQGDVAFSPDGKMLASGGYASALTLWDVATRSVVATVTFRHHVQRVAFTPDGKALIAAGEGPVTLLDAKTGKERATLKLVMEKNNTNLVLDLAVTADGKTLCTGHGDGRIKFWDLGTGEARFFVSAVEKPQHREVACVAFSADGKLACGFGDGTVKLFDVATGKERMSVKAHTVRAWSVAFSPDDKTLVSGGWDGKIRLWEVSTGRELAGFAAHNNRVYAVAFTKDGKTLVSGGGIQFERGEAKLWDVAALVKSRRDR